MCTCLTCTSRGACRGWFVFMSVRNRPSRALGRETCTSKRGLISTSLYKSDLSSGLIDSTLLAYLYTARVYTQGVLGGRCLVHCSAKWASHAGSARAVCEKMRLQAHPIVHRRSVRARCAGVEDEGRGTGTRDEDKGRGRGTGSRDGVEGSPQPQASNPQAPGRPHPTSPHLTSAPRRKTKKPGIGAGHRAERNTRFELATFGLGSQRSTN